MTRIRLGLKMTAASWRIIRSQPSLAAFPLLAAAFSLVYLLIIVLPLSIFAWLSGGSDNNIIMYAIIGVSLLGSSVGATFFGVAAVSNAAAVMDGQDPTLRNGLAHAWSRKGVIVQWALLSATIGLALRILADRLGPLAGPLLQIIGGLIWGVASFFAIPVLALEGVGPLDVLRRSVSVVRERWGESLTGNITVNLVTGLVGFVFIAIMALGIATSIAGGWLIGAPLIVIGITGLVVAMLVGSLLNSVFRLVVYRYATTGEVIEGFDPSELQQVFRPRNRR